jgi:cell division protein FtsQ
MVDLDEAAAARRVERLPWVADATVHRVWPNTVSIEVRERAPAATVPAARGGSTLVDATGRVLGPATRRADDRPALEGVPRAGAPGTRLQDETRPALEVARALTPGLRTRVAAVVLRPDGELQLRLRPEGLVRLGDAAALTPKLVAAEAVLGEVDGRVAVAVLDVRTPETPVLTHR